MCVELGGIDVEELLADPTLLSKSDELVLIGPHETKTLLELIDRCHLLFFFLFLWMNGVDEELSVLWVGVLVRVC